MASHKERVHAVLRAALAAGPYRPASYDASTDALQVDEASSVSPESIKVNEVGATFDRAERNRREILDEKSSWTWVGLVHFQKEVSFEDFESAMKTPLLVPRDQALGQPQVRLHLRRAEYFHPTTQSASSGSQARFTFEADLWPL